MQQKLKSKETSTLEQSTLKKLQQLYAIKDKITTLPTANLDGKTLSQERYLTALLRLSDIYAEIQRLKSKQTTIQTQLFTLKNNIEKSLSHEQNQSLLNQQLLYAFYKISKMKITHSLTLYEKIYAQESQKALALLPQIYFSDTNTHNIIRHSEAKTTQLQNKNLLLKIDQDSEAKRDKKAQQSIQHDAKTLQQERDTNSITKIKAKSLLALKSLQEKNHKDFLTQLRNIDTDIHALSPPLKAQYDAFFILLTSFESAYFDHLFASTQLELETMTHTFSDFFHKTLFVYEEKAFTLQTILTFFTLIMIGFVIAKVYTNIINRFHVKNRIKSLSTARLIANSGYYFIILSTFFTALKVIGLDIHTILLLIGAILVWLALGLQGFISNYAMGILIKVDRSIRIGDLIELDPFTSGNVDDMNFRAISIKTSDNAHITIPNARFISGTFINHSLEEPARRIHIPFSAHHALSLKTIESTILTCLSQSDIPHLGEKKARVIITSIHRKVTKYSLLVWINQQDNYDSSLIQADFFALIQRSLQQRKILK